MGNTKSKAGVLKCSSSSLLTTHLSTGNNIKSTASTVTAITISRVKTSQCKQSRSVTVPPTVKVPSPLPDLTAGQRRDLLAKIM